MRIWRPVPQPGPAETPRPVSWAPARTGGAAGTAVARPGTGADPRSPGRAVGRRPDAPAPERPEAASTPRGRVVIVDDHAVVRAGLRALIAQEDGLRLVGEAGDARQAVRLVERRAPDVVVMDVSLPGTNGVDAIAEIRHRHPGVRILMLSIHDGAEYVREAFARGAAGYVLKEAAPAELVTAIRTVADGGRYLHPTLGAKLLAPPPGPSARRDPLSPREREVLRLIARGHTNQEVAEHLFVSVRTVEAHRSHILSKLRLETRADLVRYAIGLGMLSRGDEPAGVRRLSG